MSSVEAYTPEHNPTEHRLEHAELEIHTTPENIPTEIGEELNDVQQRPDVQKASEEYLEENLQIIQQIEADIQQIKTIEQTPQYDQLIEPAITTDFVQEATQQLIAAVHASDEYHKLQELEERYQAEKTRLESLPESYSAYFSTPSKDEVIAAAAVLDIKISKLKYYISSSYRQNIEEATIEAAQEQRRQWNQAVSELHDFQRTEQPYIDPRTLLADLAYEAPTIDMNDISNYPDKATQANGAFRQEVIQKIVTNPTLVARLAREQGSSLQEKSEYAINEALAAIGLRITEPRTIADIARRQLGSKVKTRGKAGLMEHFADKALQESEQLFTESALPAYYLGQDNSIREQLNQLSTSLNYYLETDQQVDLAEKLYQTSEIFGESIDRYNDLYWHATPVLDLIIESKQLSPRTHIPVDKRVTNTGEHSIAPHFSREGFDYAHYSNGRAEADNKRSRGSKKWQRVNGLSAVIVPLGVMAKYAPIRQEKPRVLPSADYNPTRRKYRDDDVVFFSDTDPEHLYDYDIPLEECFISVSDNLEAQTREQLASAGYSAEWIDEHLIVMKSELFKPEPITNLPHDPQLGDTGRALEVNGDGVFDKASGRQIRIATNIDRIESYVSHTIKEKLPTTPVVPLRVVNTEEELEHVDNNTTYKLNGPGRERPRRRTRSAAGPYGYQVQKLAAV